MTPNYEYLLDDIGWQILTELLKDAGVSYREIGERIGLTGAAVAERVKKMRDAGIIKATRIELNYERLGLPVTAFIKINAGENTSQLREFISTLPQVSEVHSVVGGESVMVKVILASLPALDELLDQFRQFGAVYPSIVLSSSYKIPHIRKNQPPERSP